MAKARSLTLCNLHKDGFCHIDRAGPIVATTGMVGGKLCTGMVCEDFEYKYICSFYKVTKC